MLEANVLLLPAIQSIILTQSTYGVPFIAVVKPSRLEKRGEGSRSGVWIVYCAMSSECNTYSRNVLHIRLVIVILLFSVCKILQLNASRMRNVWDI